MGKRYSEITLEMQAFIARQKVFFVATAEAQGRINLSPKGLDGLRVVDSNTVVWLNLTGSGNETAAHLRASPRMTLMFCAFEGDPMILRLYGEARAIHRRDLEWTDHIGLFGRRPGARQIVVMKVDLTQTSCGFGVPLYDFRTERDALPIWAERKGEDGLRTYQEQKNIISLDGKPTGMIT